MGLIKKITIIGSGNVGSHLARLFYNKGFNINEVYSRSLKKAEELAVEISSKPCANISDLNNASDLYVIAVKDDAIEEVIKDIPFNNKSIVHTSGSVNIDIFNGVINEYGSLYPLQTFSKGVALDYSSIEWCLESNSYSLLAELKTFVSSFSERVNIVSSKQRLSLHTAAVYACNFTNFMQVVAEEICNKEQVDYKLLQALIKETYTKSLVKSPNDVQTGPAKRNDKLTMKKHREVLAFNKDYQELYKKISTLISNKYND